MCSHNNCQVPLGLSVRKLLKQALVYNVFVYNMACCHCDQYSVKLKDTDYEGNYSQEDFFPQSHDLLVLW